ncbi:MAG: hypothetical protein KF687_14590 [Cyclobacteriaceae bacterium]|nr:hypothetical protein [Cyclobacteriaceae bacterium]
MKPLVSIFCSLFLSSGLTAQSDSVYQSLVARASLFHLQKDYKNAITYYEQAFQKQQPDVLTAYKAAGMYSLDNNADKAFHYLHLSLSSGWTEADWLSFDPYFDYLRNSHSDKWKKLEEKARLNESQYEKTLQMSFLRKEINLMALNDQKLRYQRIQADSDSARKRIAREIMKTDITNMNKAKEIVRQYGWPKISQIGKDGQNNLWLIVQHADQDVLFQQAALLAMEKLKETSEINMENYAFLYDRVQCNLNYKQLYGTQVVWTRNGQASAFRPILNEHMTDELRQKIGLQPLRVYALTYGFVYHPIGFEQSNKKDSDYIAQVLTLLDSAKLSYKKKEFQKTYDFYNTASTFLGGMSNEDNFEAAIIFSKIASENNEDADKYKSIALDFLDLLVLRGDLSKSKLKKQPSFKILFDQQRWIDINKRLK